MKLNHWILLGATSCLIGIIPAFNGLASQTANSAPNDTNSMVAQTQSVAIASGTFVAGEAPTTGTARIVTEGGHRYLEIDSAFSTSNMGPDLHVLLDTSAQPSQSYSNLGGSLNLGSLQNFSGAQRYPIPDAIDIASFNSVVIWCRMANATFGYAPLNPVSSASIR